MTGNSRKIELDDEKFDRAELFGMMDANLKVIEEETGVSIVQRDGELTLIGGDIDTAETVLRELSALVSKGTELDRQKVIYVIELAHKGISYTESQLDKDIVCFTHMGRPVKAKTIGQKNYIRAMKNSEIVFGIGPAGTGKTYLAVAMAVNALRKKEVSKIILARPAVEAGERLGFLPGDLQDKVDPYLRPLYDALYDVLGKDAAARLKEKEVIEVVPLAYMRGRTLDDSFIILDEAQNTTPEQMKMFLTRLGFRSKMVVTGDITQIDLPDGKKSGLKTVLNILKDVDDIEIVRFSQKDVVRHKLVQDIIKAYERYDERNAKNNK